LKKQKFKFIILNMKTTAKKQSINNSIAGLCGHLSTGLVYPLELIKIRLQGKINYLKIASEERIQIHRLIKQVYQLEGVPGFFRGYFFSILAGGVANLVFFWK
jgi:hypothetical protein